MIFLRSLTYNVLFYVNLIVWLICAIPTFVLPPRYLMAMAQGWAKTALWLLKVICNTGYEVRGMEKLPAGGYIMAGKHQSFWETFALLTLVKNPVFILKRELMWIPLFGWCLAKTSMIPIDRGAKTKALAMAMGRAKEEVSGNGRQLIIFPEGTRRPAGAEPSYKFGIAHIYADLGVPCVPVALNTGLYWPRRKFLRYPGTILVEILDPIPAGLDKQVFFERMQASIEEGSNRLLAEGRKQLGRAG